MRSKTTWLAAGAVVVIWLLWTFFVYYQGFGIGPFGPNAGESGALVTGASERYITPDFARTGTFGDSYGGFSALISSLALIGVIFSLRISKEDAKNQSFDANFYSLLNHFQQIASSIDVHRSTEGLSPHDDKYDREIIATGRDALRFILELWYFEISKQNHFSDSKLVYRAYCSFYERWSDDLGHYFRLLYHIFKMIDESCPGDKIFYSRIVRAHLSQSELALLAYNCIVGEGRHKFAKYVEDYSLLHNLGCKDDDFSVDEQRFFRRWLKPKAFRFEEEPPFTYRNFRGDL